MWGRDDFCLENASCGLVLHRLIHKKCGQQQIPHGVVGSFLELVRCCRGSAHNPLIGFPVLHVQADLNRPYQRLRIPVHCVAGDVFAAVTQDGAERIWVFGVGHFPVAREVMI